MRNKNSNFKWYFLEGLSDSIAEGFKWSCIVSAVGIIAMAIWTAHTLSTRGPQ